MKSNGIVIDVQRDSASSNLILEIRKDDGNRFYSQKLSLELSDEELLGRKVLFFTKNETATNIEFSESLDDKNTLSSSDRTNEENSSKDTHEKETAKSTAKKSLLKRFRWQLIGLTLVFGYWIYLGAPNIDAILSEQKIAEACLSLAEQNKSSLIPFISVDKISIGQSWIKDGHRVIEIVVEPRNDSNLYARLCIYGKGSNVEIVSLLEQNRWK